MDKRDYLRRWWLIFKPVEELDYLRRWWPILVLALIIGAVAGDKIGDPKFVATTYVQFEALKRPQRDAVDLRLISIPQETPRAAFESLVSTATDLEKRVGAPSTISELSIREVADWKNMVFAAGLGVLLAIVGIWVFEEIRKQAVLPTQT